MGSQEDEGRSLLEDGLLQVPILRSFPIISKLSSFSHSSFILASKNWSLMNWDKPFIAIKKKKRLCLYPIISVL